MSPRPRIPEQQVGRPAAIDRALESRPAPRGRLPRSRERATIPMTTPSTTASTELVRRLDAAIDAPDDGTRCQQVRAALEWGAERADEIHLVFTAQRLPIQNCFGLISSNSSPLLVRIMMRFLSLVNQKHRSRCILRLPAKPA